MVKISDMAVRDARSLVEDKHKPPGIGLRSNYQFFTEDRFLAENLFVINFYLKMRKKNQARTYVVSDCCYFNGIGPRLGRLTWWIEVVRSAILPSWT